jgi:hypothetical protein
MNNYVGRTIKKESDNKLINNISKYYHLIYFNIDNSGKENFENPVISFRLFPRNKTNIDNFSNDNNYFNEYTTPRNEVTLKQNTIKKSDTMDPKM